MVTYRTGNQRKNCFLTTCHPCFMMHGGSWALTLVNPRKGETMGVAVICAGSHPLTRCKVCFNNEAMKDHIFSLPYKPLGGWLLKFVVTSQSRFLKIFKFKQNPCAGLSLKLQTKVISGSGYLKKIQRTG